MLLEGRTIAVIEDDPIMGESLQHSLSLEGAKVSLYPSGQAALKIALWRGVDLIVCDMRLPDTDGQSLFRRLGTNAGAPPFMFMTAYADLDQAVRLMREGAADYVTKPFAMDTFLARVRGSLRPAQIGAGCCATLGVSPAMREIEHLLRIVAKTDSPVLLTGETGTGKDVCARFLHRIAEKRGPFIAVNCAAIPRDLLESELFGHEAGAFTGAGRRHAGYAERAAGGTLFLDEIGELAPGLQAKLLRLLEDRHFHRVGGEAPVPFRARLVSATNADLPALMAAKLFRPDLYYRINVVEMRVPALRERREDIVWLMNAFLAEFAQAGATPIRGLSAPAEQAVLAHGWPGNVRELKNRIERAMTVNLTGWISPQDLFPDKPHGATPCATHSWSLAETREAAEKQRIITVLAENDGQIGRTAEALVISRTTLWEKMKRYGLAGE